MSDTIDCLVVGGGPAGGRIDGRDYLGRFRRRVLVVTAGAAPNGLPGVTI